MLNLFGIASVYTLLLHVKYGFQESGMPTLLVYRKRRSPTFLPLFNPLTLFVHHFRERREEITFANEPFLLSRLNSRKRRPSLRQTLMYTATWPKEVHRIAADLLVNPVQVNIGNVNELVSNKAITQYVEVLPPMDKRKRLEQILRSQEPGSKVIIFCSTKKMCDQLTRNLTRQFGAATIPGDKSQGDRDIKDIRVVVNFDFPNGVEDYVHRIGRTGRAGATGVAYTFLCEACIGSCQTSGRSQSTCS
ncbi:DEAD-box ATP-dependent RNA helicase 46 [Castilleja foliolosa]|uniref:DEAD-box ATP-dependent RNA helicase 46 n=1 Tax=Castilleja foliolosa TaxID=1961234 RepID=A0ABD3C4L5_9LAMI